MNKLVQDLKDSITFQVRMLRNMEAIKQKDFREITKLIDQRVKENDNKEKR